MKGRLGSASSSQSLVPTSLTRLAAGYFDQELATVRRMARDGARAVDIGAACGKSEGWATQYIRRNKLVWNKPKGGGAKPGLWHALADEMKADGRSIQQIATACGISSGSVVYYFKHQLVAAGGDE